jgi:hypothetical protein
MRISLIHGDYTRESIKKLQEIENIVKGKSWEIVRINKDSTLSLPEMLTSTSLFDKKRVFVVSDISSLRDDDWNWLRKNSEKLKGNLIIYHPESFPGSIRKKLPKDVRIKEYKLPRLIFKFLESFYPGNAKESLSLLHKILETENVEFVFSLLCRHLRDLYWVLIDASSIPYPSWRVLRIEKQSGKFNTNKLTRAINELAIIDIKNKTSQQSLNSLLDLLIITQLE